MVDLQEMLWGFSIISLAIYFLQSSSKICISKYKASATWFGRVFDIQEKSFVLGTDSNPELGSSDRKDGGVIFNEECSNYLGLGLMVPEIESAASNSKKSSIRMKKRPSMLIVPHLQAPAAATCSSMLEFEFEGRDFCLASRKGKREIMEDRYSFMVDILGDPKQALFAVIDGHGGHAAADYVAQHLGNNIVKALDNDGGNNIGWLQQAIRRGYLVTDKDFLSQGVCSGACTATVLLKNGELHVANVGDCRVVVSRKGVASAITNDHRLSSRPDERLRIETSGGFVQYSRNGVWRVQGSLAVSRAIGDLHLKQWIISEPEITTLPLTSDCEFLVLASDGLWDKVNGQEAVNVVLKERNAQESCRKLIDISCTRGNMDDITVMVVNLENFVL